MSQQDARRWPRPAPRSTARCLRANCPEAGVEQRRVARHAWATVPCEQVAGLGYTDDRALGVQAQHEVRLLAEAQRRVEPADAEERGSRREERALRGIREPRGQPLEAETARPGAATAGRGGRARGPRRRRRRSRTAQRAVGSALAPSAPRARSAMSGSRRSSSSRNVTQRPRAAFSPLLRAAAPSARSWRTRRTRWSGAGSNGGSEASSTTTTSRRRSVWASALTIAPGARRGRSRVVTTTVTSGSGTGVEA